MGRTIRDSKTDSPTARGKLAPSPEPYWVKLAPKLSLGYYRPKKGAGTWRGRLYIPGKGLRKEVLGQADDGQDPADGERILTFAQAQIAAGKWAQGILDEMKHGSAGVASPKGVLTVDQALDCYFEAAGLRGMKGLAGSIQRANVWIRPDLGQIEVDSLSRDRIEQWLKRMADSPKRVRKAEPKPGAHVPVPRNFKVPRPAKPKAEPPAPPSTPEEIRQRRDSANRVLTILKAALNDALDRNRVRCSGDAWRRVRPFAEAGRARVRFLTAEEQVRLVNACEGAFKDLVKGALKTGARYGELTRIRVQDFSASGGTVFIEKSKSGKSRHIVLDVEGQALFTELTAGRPADALVFDRGTAGRKTRKELGTAWGASDQVRPMKAACEAAKLALVSFHELRHSYASTLVNQGVPLAYVKDQLGHASTVMVDKHYGHLAPSAMADAIRAAMPSLGFGEAKVKPLKLG